MRYLSVIISLILISGCSFLKPYKVEVPQGNLITQEMLQQVEIGMSKQQVQYLLGTPITQTPMSKDSWLYYYQQSKAGKIITKQAIRLFFEAESLTTIDGTATVTDSNLGD